MHGLKESSNILLVVISYQLTYNQSLLPFLQ
jgi:hypothetical protein